MKKTFITSNTRRLLAAVFLTASVSFMTPVTDVSAQGLYRKNASSGNVENENDSHSGTFSNDGDGENGEGSGKSLRAGSREEGGQQSRVPLKDGWSILVIAGIGYGCCIALRKRRDGYGGEWREA